MEVATFSFGKWYRRATLVSIPIVGLLSLVTLVAGIFGAVTLSGGWYAKMSSVTTAGIGAWMMVSMCQWVRYRHILLLRCAVEEAGLRITSPNGDRWMPWREFERADYIPLFYMLRLIPVGDTAPIVLFLIRRNETDPTSDEKNKLARELVERGMHGKYGRRWIP
jgi:hypothetical protein